MIPLRQHPIVAIHWRDAIGDRHDEVDPPHCLSVGWLIKRTRTYVRVAHEILQDGSYCEITTIPRGMVQSINALAAFPYPEPFNQIKRLSNKEG